MADTATNLGQIELTTKPARVKTATAKPVRLLQQYFYFFMSLLIAAIVMYGFSHTVEKNLIHATPVRPFLLYVHGAIFSGWVAFFIFQSLLVRTHNVRLHRTLGWFGAALGAAISVLGISTAITMTRFQMFRLHAVEDAVTDLLGPFLYHFAVNRRVIKRPDRKSTGRRSWSEAPLALGANGAGLSRQRPLPRPGY